MSVVFSLFNRLDKAWNEMTMRPKGVLFLLLLLLGFGAIVSLLALDTLKVLGGIVILAGIVYPMFLDKWRAGFSFLLVLIGTILLLQEQKWFQGFFQNTTVVLLQKQGRTYGDKLQDFHDAMARLNAENLSNSIMIASALNTVTQQQSRIDFQQQSLNEAESRVTGLLASAETTLRLAEEKQRNIETNLYALSTNLTAVSGKSQDGSLLSLLTDWQYESHSFADTNSLLTIEKEDGAVILLVRLERPAIFSTIESDISSSTPGRSLSPLRDNIYAHQITRELFDQSVTKNGVFVKYLPSPSSTNTFSWTIISSNTFAINGLTMTPVKGFILPKSQTTNDDSK